MGQVFGRGFDSRQVHFLMKVRIYNECGISLINQGFPAFLLFRIILAYYKYFGYFRILCNTKCIKMQHEKDDTILMPQSELLWVIFLLNPSLELVNESLFISGKSVHATCFQCIDLICVEVLVIPDRNSIVNHLVLISFRCNVVQLYCKNL